MATWERKIPRLLSNWLESISWDCLPHGRFLIKPNDANATLTAMLLRSGTPSCKQARLFITDAVETIFYFSEIAGIKLVDVCVDAVKHDACWKFHRDCVPLRLITTYLGPGTEYVAPADSDRAIREQKRFDGIVYQVPQFAVSVFNGSSNADDIGVVHRSPPISGTGLRRLILCLNMPSATSPPLFKQPRRHSPRCQSVRATGQLILLGNSTPAVSLGS